MKKALLIVFLLGLVPTVSAQTSNTGSSSECKLKLAQAPVIRGIRLGMTVNDVLAVFPGAEIDEEVRRGLSQVHFGSTGFWVGPSKFGSKDKFVGVRSVSFAFLDGDLNSFSVEYNGPEFRSGEQFITRIVGPLNLPGIEFWKGTALNCEGFAVTVQVSSQNRLNSISVRNLDKDATKIVREREEAVKEEARRAFKP
jgi:hypothetical protein